jgi:hypothetical protein
MTDGVQISGLPQAQALTGQELVPLVAVGHISGITQANTAVITISDPTPVNPFLAGENVGFKNVGGMTQLNGQGAVVAAVGGTSGAWTIAVPINSSGFGAFTGGGTIIATASIPLASMRLSAGIYSPIFDSGPLQYAGPNGTVAGNNNFIVGNLIPNPGGVPGPFLLLGSGGGLGLNVSFWIGQDQAFDTSSPGNDLGITAGEVQPGSALRGGNLWQIAGAADLGTAGSNTQQGGTSARGPGGMQISLGGNNTDGNHPPGDNFVIAGEVGSQGANTHIVGTILNGIPGVIHSVRFNSTFVIDHFNDGRIYSYASNGFGTPIAPWISRGSTPGQAAGWAGASEVATGMVVLRRLTDPGGTNGSLTIVNGLITAIVDPT